MLRRNVHLDEHDTEAQVDLRTRLESGITASFFAAYVPPYYAGRGAANQAYTLRNNQPSIRNGAVTSHRSPATNPRSAARISAIG